LEATAELSKTLLARREPIRLFSMMAPPLSPAPARNVVGVGVGLDADELVLDIYVVKKFPDSQIQNDERLPQHFGQRRTRIRESNFFRLLAAAATGPREVVRPLVPGLSIGPLSVNTAGTLGGFVTDGTAKYMLSNNHVLAVGNTVAIGMPVVQPGLYDGGAPTNAVGKLTKFIPFVSGPEMRVDCAIAQVDDGVDWKNTSGKRAITGHTAPALGMAVEKFGRTTGHTTGTITSIKFGLNVPFEDRTGKAIELNFVDQITIGTSDNTAFADLGDSGSVVLEKSTAKAVGLVTAGSEAYTLANDIREVLKQLGGLTFA
jgi:hypothetical protein